MTTCGDYDGDYDGDYGDWAEGTCDRCSMRPGEMIEPFGVHCACWGGGGAPQDSCSCPWGTGEETS